MKVTEIGAAKGVFCFDLMNRGSLLLLFMRPLVHSVSRISERNNMINCSRYFHTSTCCGFAKVNTGFIGQS